MKEQYTLSAGLMQVSLGGILCTLSCFMSMSEQSQTLFFPGILLVYAPLVYMVNRLFLRRDRILISWILLNVILAVLMTGSVAWVESGWPGLQVPLLIALATLRGAMICQNPPKLSSAILWLEINVVILAVFLGIWSSVGGNLLWSIPSGIGAGAALLAVIVHRMNGRMSAREWFLLFLVFACMGGLLWLLVTFLAAPTGQGVVMIWDGFLSAMQFIGGQIQRFLTFLTSFLKPEHYEEVELEDLSGMNMDTSANDAMAASFGRFLAIFVIVAVILAVVAALIVFGRVRLTRKTIQGSPQKKRQSQRPSLLDAVRELLRRVSAYLHLKKALWAARNTELGVYFALVRLCKRSAYRQQTGDTPSTFLARLETICGEPELSRSLAELRGRVESSLYSGKDKSEHFPNGKVLKQQIKKQIRHEKSSKSNV